MNSNSSYNNNQNNSISTRSNNIIKDKGFKELKSPLNTPLSTHSNLNNAINAIKCSRKKNSNKLSKTHKQKNIKKDYLLTFQTLAYNNIFKKYNYTIDKFNLLCINYLLGNRSCRLVSVFKEKMITDYVDEFLKRKYSFNESKERIPKFYLYYKHYSIFFGQPFFSNFYFNVVLQKNGEKKARIYYKNHYQNGESKDEDNENIGFAESGSDEEDEDKKNNLKKNNNGTIFSSDIKDNIDNVTVMTTINSFENNTINLALNNEKIEIFSENKMEKSNDTTIGELMDDINRGIEEANRAKNKNLLKKKKKKNFSLGDNFFNLINKNNNAINDNIKKNKKKLIELINNNNIKKKIKNNSIKKKLFYVGHQNINLNFNNGASLSSNTQRYNNNKKNNISIKKDTFNKKNISSSNTNHNINSTKAYKKRKLLSYTNEEVNKLMDNNNNNNTQNNLNKHKSPRQFNNMNINDNYLNTINANPIYGLKKINNMPKIQSPISINKKRLISNCNNLNSNTILSSINHTRNVNKIKICKTLKCFAEKNKNKKNISKNIVNKDLVMISGDKKKRTNKISFKKFELDNFSEAQIFKENHINKKTKGRNIISPLNNKLFENHTMTSEYTNMNNLPFSANKNKNFSNNNKIFNNKAFFSGLAFQTISNDQETGHQRTKSNYIQNTTKRTINNNPTFTKVLNTETNSAYIKPAIRIKKNDKLYISKPMLNEVTIENNNFGNKTINSNNNNVYNSKKVSNNNAHCLSIVNSNATSNKDYKINSINNMIHNKNIKNTNFNKYILEVIKKSKHQHYNSLTSQINPNHALNIRDNILTKNKKKFSNNNLNHTKGYKDKDVLQIALSLFVNENTSRNLHNQTNILEPANTTNNNNFNTYYKINNTRPALQKNQNNNKRNYNLNININNEININENNTINNSTYINHTHRMNNKNVGTGKNYLNNYLQDDSKQKEKKKCIVNLKQKKYNIDTAFNTNRNNNNCQSAKNNNINENLIMNLNNKKGKKIKTRNYGNKDINELLSTINNNLINTMILNNNNSVDNKIIGSNFNKLNGINNKNINNNTIKSYHTKSVTSLSDLMFHNKKLISLYKNLSKSK